MHYEVEQKFRVANPADLERPPGGAGRRIRSAPVAGRLLLRPSARDFAATDEALRIRRVGDANFVTYKGPKLDQSTKTRREIEVPLADGEQPAADFGNLLVGAGLSPGGRGLQAAAASGTAVAGPDPSRWPWTRSSGWDTSSNWNCGPTTANWKRPGRASLRWRPGWALRTANDAATWNCSWIAKTLLDEPGGTP